VTPGLARDPERLAAALLAPNGFGGAGVPGALGDVRVVRAPGRVNLIGEHTDYNEGLVLPAAIDRWVAMAFLPTDDPIAAVRRLDTGEMVEVDLADPGQPDGTWRDYVAGTVWALGEAGAPVSGFRGVLVADLPMGAGLSSSAALELATALALGGGRPPIDDPMTLARTARRAENDYVGVPCGLMDQFAVTFGVAGSALLLDCRSLEHEVVALPQDVDILVCDSGVERRLAGSAYETRRDECRRAVEALRAGGAAVTSLRDADEDLLERARDTMDPVAFRRARHVVTENARVLEAVAALRGGSPEALGPLFRAGHASLRDDFEVSTPELDELVDIATATPGVLAARLTGAGFGGAIVALVAADATAQAIDGIRRGYRTPGGSPPDVLRVRAAAGAALAWPPP
jgi:galactokinase